MKERRFLELISNRPHHMDINSGKLLCSEMSMPPNIDYPNRGLFVQPRQKLKKLQCCEIMRDFETLLAGPEIIPSLGMGC
jgi:hypothetical protein